MLHHTLVRHSTVLPPRIYQSLCQRNRGLEGKSITQIAQAQGKSVMDAFLDLSLDEELQTFFICVDRNTDPAAQKQILGSPYTVIGTSDGGARPHSAEELDFLAAHVVGVTPDTGGVTYRDLSAAPAVLCVAFEPEEE